jgi:hypothetical protein
MNKSLFASGNTVDQEIAAIGVCLSQDIRKSALFNQAMITSIGKTQAKSHTQVMKVSALPYNGERQVLKVRTTPPEIRISVRDKTPTLIGPVQKTQTPVLSDEGSLSQAIAALPSIVKFPSLFGGQPFVALNPSQNALQLPGNESLRMNLTTTQALHEGNCANGFHKERARTYPSPAVTSQEQNVGNNDVDRASSMMPATVISLGHRCEARMDYQSMCSYEGLEAIDEASVVIWQGNAFALNRSTKGMLLLMGLVPHAKQLIEVHTLQSGWWRAANVFEVRWTRPVQVESFGNLYLAGCRHISGYYGENPPQSYPTSSCRALSANTRIARTPRTH